MIKASNILESISSVFRIDERNLANVDDVDHYIDSFIDMFTDPGTKKWLTSKNTLRKYLINDFPGVIELPSIPARGDEYYQPWMDKLPEGEKIYVLDDRAPGMRDLTTQIRHIMDYFDYATKNENEIPTPLKVRDPSRISFEDALKKSQEWVRWYNTRKKDDEEEGYGEGESILKILPGGLKWVEVHSQAALDREGDKMNHCVGTYGDRVRRKDCDIISLRDSNNEPIVTIDMRGDEVNQIKGKRDGPVEDRYQKVVFEFIKDKELTDEGYGDLINIGCVWSGTHNKIVSLDDVILADFYNDIMGDLPYDSDEEEILKRMSPAQIDEPDKKGVPGIFYVIDDTENKHQEKYIEILIGEHRHCMNVIHPETGETALMRALTLYYDNGQPNLQVAYMFMSDGRPDYKIRNKNGYSILHYAIDSQDDWMIAEASVYHTPKADDDILVYAVEQGVSSEALDSIIRYCDGVDLGKDGQRALDMAIERDYEWLEDKLREEMGLDDEDED
jgi:hypothetical protein